MKKRFFAMALAVVLLVGMMSGVLAADVRGPFVSYAGTLVGKSGPDLGFGNSNWCVRFVNYCAKNNGGGDISGLFPDTGSVTSSAKHFAGLGRYYYFDDTYIPGGSDARKQGVGIPMNTEKIEKGDLAYFISNSDGGFEHIGIVETVNSNGVTIVHGSWSNRVARTNVVFGKTIGSNYPVRFAGIAKPDYASAGSTSETVPSAPLKIAPTTEPTEHMTLGAPFYFRGSITSGSAVTSATVSILSSDGSVLQTRSITPNKTSVDILNDGLDSLKFGQLEEGAYTLKLTATDAAGATQEWSKVFSIGNATLQPAASTLVLSPAKEPGEKREPGKPFQFDGWAESNYDIVFTAIVQGQDI